MLTDNRNLVPWFCFPLIAGILMHVTSAQAQPEEKPTWRLETEADQSLLTYGTDNAEEIPIVFSCKTGEGAIRIFIAETGGDLKPNRPVTASLTAGAVISKIKGLTLPNELAGIPSFEGTLPPADPLFAALPKAKQLVMAVGASSHEVPLQDIGDKAGRFIRLCRKS